MGEVEFDLASLVFAAAVGCFSHCLVAVEV